MSTPTRPGLALAGVIACIVAGLAGCTTVSVTAPAGIAVPAAFTQVPAAEAPDTPDTPGAPAASQDLSQWWQNWNDPELTQRVTRALEANPDLRVAQARVAEARATGRAADSALYPTLSAQAQAARGVTDLRSPAGLPDMSPGVEGYLAGATVAWEIDIFGGRRSDAQAAAAAALGAEAQWRGTRLAIAADVAENYLAARGLQRRLHLLDQSTATVAQLLRYTRARQAAGQALRYDIDRVSEQLGALQAQRPVLLSQIALRERRLAVLAGEAPQRAAALPAPPPFFVPPAPAGQIPSEVIQRRPDVGANAALVQAQAARLGSAKAEMFPRFYLTFLGQDGRLHLDGLPALSGAGGLLGVGVQLPIFTAGRVQAGIDAADARLQAAQANYDAAVLRTLEEVDNAYNLRHSLDQRGATLAAVVATAQRNSASAVQLYEGGRRTLQDVLDARIDALRREDEQIQTQTGQAVATVQLYRALGGGWPAGR
ncbi:MULTISPECIES: efflux transporter outer membrane subunit [Cupriavidus]